MRLENLLALTGAKLVNKPCINNFENIVFDAKRIKRGDLYIAKDIDTINLAVINGAYGIVYDGQTPFMFDDEIAWIQVDNIEKALEKLLRFRLIENEIIVYKCDEIVFKLAAQIITDDNFIVMTQESDKIFKQLWQLPYKTTLLFCPSLQNSDLFTNIKSISTLPSLSIEIIEQTLFETSFIYDNKYYERQFISPFFIPYLEELFHLYRSLHINFKLKKFTSIDNFEAVFTNKNLEIKDFGASNKVLIFEKNSALIEKEIEFLQQKAPWANIIYILPDTINYRNTTNIIKYQNDNEIVTLLKQSDFHFALVVGVDKSILTLSTINQAKSLFEV